MSNGAFVCGNCAFWKPDTERTPTRKPDSGDCRRGAPRLRFPHQMSDDLAAVWPPTWADDWCGEHRPNTLPLPLPAPGASPSRWQS